MRRLLKYLPRTILVFCCVFGSKPQLTETLVKTKFNKFLKFHSNRICLYNPYLPYFYLPDTMWCPVATKHYFQNKTNNKSNFPHIRKVPPGLRVSGSRKIPVANTGRYRVTGCWRSVNKENEGPSTNRIAGGITVRRSVWRRT